MNWIKKNLAYLLGIIFALIVVVLLVFGILNDGVRDKDPSSLYFITNSGEYNRQCSLPMLYAFNQNVSSYVKDVFIDSFNYWNNLSDNILFINIGDSEYNIGDNMTSSFTIIDVKEKFQYYKYNDELQAAEDIAAVTLFKYKENGCMFGTGILIFQETLDKYNREEIETIVRHEIGHVLGFHHSDKKEDLMYPTTSLEFNQNHPKGLSDWEIKAFDVYYK